MAPITRRRPLTRDAVGFDEDFLIGRWKSEKLAKKFAKKKVTYSIDGTPQAPLGPKSTERRSKAASDVLTDSLRNVDSYVVVSEALRELIERFEKHVEFLPVTLMAPKKKVVEQKYFIINPQDAVDAIDLKQSKLQWAEGKKAPQMKGDEIDDSINRAKSVVLDESRVPPERSLFLLKYFDFKVVIRRELADAIAEAGLTGLEPQPVSEYSWGQ